MQALRRRLGWPAAVLAVTCVLPTAAAGAGQAGGDWLADARASAADIGAVTTGGFIVDRFDPSAALATSHLETGTQVATSLASAPYPSEIGQQFPGLLFGVLQNTLPYNGIPVPALGTAPSWPFTIRSSANGTDPTSATAGGETSPMWLKTQSAERSTSAFAAIGGSAPGAFSMMRNTATSNADATQAGRAVVKAVSTVENLAIGDALQIGKIRTELTIVQPNGGAKAEVTVKRQVTGISVGGQATEMGSDGLPQPARDVLKAAGIEVSLGEQRDTATGGISVSGLVIRRPFDFSQMSGGNLPLSVPKTMVLEMAFGVATGRIADLAAGPAATDGGTAQVSRPTLRLIADTAPMTREEKDLGPLGWLAMITSIAAVLWLVVARGRRVVGGA